MTHELILRIDYYDVGAAAWKTAITASGKSSTGWLLQDLEGWWDSTDITRVTSKPLAGSGIITSPRGQQAAREIRAELKCLSNNPQTLQTQARSLQNLGRVGETSRFRIMLYQRNSGSYITTQYIDAYAAQSGFVTNVTLSKGLLECELNFEAPNPTITQKAGKL